MNPDTLLNNKEIIESSINWWQIISQTFIFGIIVELARRYFQRELENLKKEFSIIQTTFSKNYSFVLDYYSNFYKHYRACQKVITANDVVYPDKTIKNTEEIFLENLDIYVSELNKVEPTIRLIFPENLVKIHDKSLEAFNAFRKLIKSYYDYDIRRPEDELISSFKKIDEIKKELEKGLRKYLRTEKIIIE